MAGAVFVLSGAAAHAGTVHDEATDGDLSGDRRVPTPLTIAAGPNDFHGATGSIAGVVDRDYARFVVPAGFELRSLTVLPGTEPAGGVSFIAIQAGTTITVDPGAAAPGPLLGWFHYSDADIGHDILGDMGAEAGSIGFTGSLPAGAYSLWIQDFGFTQATYGFRLEIRPVPEPATWGLLGAGLSATLVVRRRHRRAG